MSARPACLRVEHEYSQVNHAPPRDVFPLLCPVREAEWVPGWRYRMTYSQSGLAELGCVFATPDDDGQETTWVITRYDRENFEIDFAWVRVGLLATRIEIRLAAIGEAETRADIKYVYTALSAEGAAELAKMDNAWFAHKMCDWERAINFFLKTGKCIVAI